MNEAMYRRVFRQFLYDYWGAFHEALEAQSVTPARLAGSLFTALRDQHQAFHAIDDGLARPDIDALGEIWRALEAERYIWPDPPLKHDDVVKAQEHFKRIFETLLQQGGKFGTARAEILAQSPHGTPKDPLRVDAAR